MKFRSIVASAVVATSALGFAAAAQASSYLVDIDATVDTLVPLELAAGTYTIDILSSPYSGWSFWGHADASCSDSGVNCENGFTNLFNMKIGDTDTLFIKMVDGSNHGYGMYGSTAEAYQAYQSGLSAGIGLNTPVAFAGKIRFTVAAPTTAYFHINDSYYGDNHSTEPGGPAAGVSLRVTAVPEPATWALMISGFGLAGVALRRRRQGVALAA